VAHDLRAPLRSMTGFAHLLLAKHREQLPAEAQDYLARIQQAGNHMGQLIDDLLTLSRITRGDLNREQVSLTALVHQVLDGLRKSDPDRKVQWAVAPDLSDSGDPRLLRVLLENLIGNAWKFTGKVEQGQIEFGAMRSATETAYFVKDNGAGFNMAYAHKLFGAFERLHDARQFPGTGIGLATAYRIVTRHGGRIWGEGAEGRGATFYFTL
jgi:light-regulated signal transduction histidine kinase (bacteriophytochrome)